MHQTRGDARYSNNEQQFSNHAQSHPIAISLHAQVVNGQKETVAKQLQSNTEDFPMDLT